MRESLRMTTVIALAVLACLPASAFAADDDVRGEGTVPPVVVDVRVEGHESATTRELLSAFGITPGNAFDEATASAGTDSVLSLLALRGSPFATVRVDWDAIEGGVRVLLSVDEARVGRVNTVAIAGEGVMTTDELLALVTAREGRPVTAALLELDASAIAVAYAERGHPLASVRPAVSAGVGQADGLHVVYEISEGPEVRFGDVRVAGNERTRSHVIVRETGIISGEPYRASVLEAVRPTLERLPYLVSVGDPAVAMNRATHAAEVGVEVGEARANRITGVLGYSPGGDGEGEFTGRADINIGNIAGTGRRAKASWERVREGHDRLAFEYIEPWVLDAPIDAGVRAEQVNRDTLYSTTEGDLFATARFGTRLAVTWSVGGERYVPGSGEEPSTDGYRTSLELQYDRRDSPLNPTRGFESSGALSYASVEANEGEESYRTGILAVAASAYVPVRRSQVVALFARGAALASSVEEVPLHQQLLLGGASSLRGYREEQFHGTTTALATVEYRFIMGRYSRLVVFLDVGHYSREGSNPKAETKLGYGAGLRGETRLGIIAIDYGLGEGDAFLDGKLHVGLIREF